MSNINNYTDSGFNLYQAHSYTLLIQVAATTFSFAIVYEKRVLLYVLDTDLAELAQPGQLSDLLNATYKNVVIGLPSATFTLVPNSLYTGERTAAFARYLDVKDHEKVFAQPFDDNNTIIYKTSDKLAGTVARFGFSHVVHSAQGWVNIIAQSKPQNNCLFLDVNNDKVQFAYFSLNALRYYNAFDFKSEDELAYFTSFVTEELNLRPQYISLVISGNTAEGDRNLTRLKNFYPRIEFNRLKVFELPEQMAAHRLLALAALSLCGSSAAN